MTKAPVRWRRRGWTIEDLWKRPEAKAAGNLRWLARVRDTTAAKYRNKAFADGRKREAEEWAKALAVRLNRPRLPRPELALAIENAPWETLVAIAQTIMNRYYPADIFTGSSGDPGPRLVAALRAVMEAGK